MSQGSLFMPTDRSKKPSNVFDSDSDTDSIKTDSTAQSEVQAEYEVERVLLENPNAEKSYLVKWAGYPLSQATWEPRENLELGGEILSEWERQKKRIEAGKVKPFEFDDYARALALAEDEKKDKRRRRNEKRKKRGIRPRTYDTPEEGSEGEGEPAGADAGEDMDGSGEVIVPSKRRAIPQPTEANKRTKRPEAVRKGVAKKVTRRRVVSDTSLSDGSGGSDGSSSSGRDSLQEELVSQAAKSKARTKQASSSSKDTAALPSRRKQSSASSTTNPELVSATTASTAKPKSTSAINASTSATKVSIVNPLNKQAKATSTKSKVASRAGPSGAARKSAPSFVPAGPERGLHDVMKHWDAPVEKRQRVRVAGEIPTDSREPQFRNLSEQNRFRKHGRDKERPPDPNALTIVDTKTGRTIPPKVPASPKGPARELPSAYQRRTPPRQERQRSMTPPSADQVVPRELPIHNASKPTIPLCKRWLTTGCPKPAQYCDLVHGLAKKPLDRLPEKKFIACWYWLLGDHCNRGSYCDYAHMDTGIYSAAPYSGDPPFTVEVTPASSLPPSQNNSTNVPQSISHPSGTSGPLPPDTPACRRWLEGSCPNHEDTCLWAHALPTEPYKGNIHSVPKQQIFCYWQSHAGKCTKRDTTCEFAHVDTGIQAGPPGSGSAGRTSIVPKPSVQDPTRHNSSSAEHSQNNNVSDAEARRRNLPPSQLTCFFWRTRNKCSKPDNVCEYAHHDTGIWAAPPPGHKGAKLYASEPMNANMIPIAASHDTIPAAQHTTRLPHVITNPVPYSAEPETVEPLRDLVASPIQLQSPPMPPPGRQDSFRRTSVSASAGSLTTTIGISFCGDQIPKQVIARLQLSENDMFDRLAGAELHLQVDRAVLASDFKVHVWEPHLRDVESTVGGVAVTDAATGQSLVELCKQHTIGLIATQTGKKSKMLIYPPSNDVWKFLDTETTWKVDCALRFRLFADIPGIEDLPTSEIQLPKQSTPPPIVLAGEELAGLESARMKSLREEGQDRAMFLLFPPTHHAELEFYAKFFAAQNYRVYHSGVAGAWQYFCDKNTDKKVVSTVVVHPDIALWQVPRIRQILAPPRSTTIFSIGTHQLELMDDPSFSCIRLFPFAIAALITDDVFVYHPEKALEILNHSVKSVKGRQEYKIVTRPGVKEWLLRLAEDGYSKQYGDTKWFALYEAMCRLCPPEDEDPYDLPNPHPDTNLVSLSPELMPNYDALWKQDEVAATSFLVEWYACWTIENMKKLRKFYVLHEPKGGFGGMLDRDGRWVSNEDPHGWAEKFQHIWFQRPQCVFNK